MNKSYYFLSGLKGDTANKNKDINSWYEHLKKFCILSNLKSTYEIGNLIGKGNFAKVSI